MPEDLFITFTPSWLDMFWIVGERQSTHPIDLITEPTRFC